MLTWTPAGALAPFTSVQFSFPTRLTATGHLPLPSALTLGFTTGPGSVLRLQQLLAQLGYLPLRFTPSAPVVTSAQAERAVFQPPTGSFAWTWPAVPSALSALWAPGQVTTMTRGAIMAFEYDHHLGVDGVAGPQVWSALLAATASPEPAANQHGYTFALASKTLPETLTVWHDGVVISRSGTNSGIAQAPTADGTFPVYERLATQIMKGKNPDGTPYADPVAWVAYFNGGDAIHYIARSSYGYPQSLGCLEVPYAVGQRVWPYLTIGSLVTVTG